MLPQNPIQPLPQNTLLKGKAFRQRIQLIHPHPSKQARKLLRKRARHKRLEHIPQQMPLRIPRRGIRLLRSRRQPINPVHQRLQRNLRRSRPASRRRLPPPRVQPQLALLVEEGLDGRVPFAGGAGVHHALEPDVLVQPDAPVDAVLVVDGELVAEEVVAFLVGGCGLGVGARVGVDGAELAVPGRCVVARHEVGFAEVLPFEGLLLFGGPCVAFACGEAHGLFGVWLVWGVWVVEYKEERTE